MGLFGSKKAKEAAADTAVEERLSDGTVVRVTRRIDCIGDSCPRPQLMTKKAVGEARPGDVIEVLVDNPSSVEALPPMCDELDATHLETAKAAHCWRVFIRKD
ncbi:MAG: sulfurtransferase TusA family protein [Burkholderiales bacterium]|nr:sulfurtransferase TusA family protein [Burkholderiales bacterium]